MSRSDRGLRIAASAVKLGRTIKSNILSFVRDALCIPYGILHSLGTGRCSSAPTHRLLQKCQSKELT